MPIRPESSPPQPGLRTGPRSPILALLSLCWIIVPNAYYAFNGTKCQLYNLLHGLAALTVYSYFAHERVRLGWEGKNMYYTYLAATMASAGVVGAILALGREGTRSFQKTGGGGEDGQPMMSDLVFRLVTGAAVACVVLQGAMVTRLARRVIQPEGGWDKR